MRKVVEIAATNANEHPNNKYGMQMLALARFSLAWCRHRQARASTTWIGCVLQVLLVHHTSDKHSSVTTYITIRAKFLCIAINTITVLGSKSKSNRDYSISIYTMATPKVIIVTGAVGMLYFLHL